MQLLLEDKIAFLKMITFVLNRNIIKNHHCKVTKFVTVLKLKLQIKCMQYLQSSQYGWVNDKSQPSVSPNDKIKFQIRPKS